jgi:hypothetical protein
MCKRDPTAVTLPDEHDVNEKYRRKLSMPQTTSTMPPDERQSEDGEELIRLFIEALAREAARYEFRHQLEEAQRRTD